METHRVLHDFQDLSLEDISNTESEKSSNLMAKQIRTTPYRFLFVAVVCGVFLGYLAKRS